MKHFFQRHQPRPCTGCPLKAGAGALLGIALVAWLGDVSGVPMLIAPFGASCVLLFSLPESPLSQPANVIGGHLLATAASLLLDGVLPDTYWAMAVTVGAVIALMGFLRLTHPPAGADPLVVLHAHPGWDFLLFPVAGGSVALVIMAVLVHRLPPRVTVYPLRPCPVPANADHEGRP